MPIITVDELRTHLNKESVADDAELAGFVDAAEEMVVERVGEVVPVDIASEEHRVDAGLAFLEHVPVLSVTTVTYYPGGTVVPKLDVPAGVLTGWALDSGVLSLPYYSGTVVVAYRSGRDPIPDRFRLAALELAAHLWRSTQNAGGGMRPSITGEDEPTRTGRPRYAMPDFVAHLLDGEHLAPWVG